MTEAIDRVEGLDRVEWGRLLCRSEYATWFQTWEAYEFFDGLREMFEPFVYGVMREDRLKGVCVGYVTREKNG